MATASAGRAQKGPRRLPRVLAARPPRGRRAGQGRAGQGRAGQGRAGQGRGGKGRKAGPTQLLRQRGAAMTGNRRIAREGALRRRARADPAALEARPKREHEVQPRISPRPCPKAPAGIRGAVAELSARRKGRGGQTRSRFLTPHRCNRTERWAERKPVWPNSPTSRYLARKRRLPARSSRPRQFQLQTFCRKGQLETPGLRAGTGTVAHVDVRGPTYRGL